MTDTQIVCALLTVLLWGVVLFWDRILTGLVTSLPGLMIGGVAVYILMHLH